MNGYTGYTRSNGSIASELLEIAAALAIALLLAWAMS